MAERLGIYCMFGEDFAENVIYWTVKILYAPAGSGQDADCIIQFMVFAQDFTARQHSCWQSVLAQQAPGDYAIKAYLLPSLFDGEQLSTNDRDDAPVFDEGEQVLPEFFGIKRYRP